MTVKRFRLLILFVLMTPLVVLGGAAHASVFEVQGVPVDVTANSADQARSQALAQGQDEAFRRLLERLTLKDDADKLPEPGSVDTTEYVSDFAVMNEKTSAVRYLAKLNVRFKAAPVRQFLRDLGIRFAETTSKPTMILAVFQVGDREQLWEDGNPWRRAWNMRQDNKGLVQIALPLGDLADISALKVVHALDGNVQRLTDLAVRYSAGDTVVSLARIGTDAASGGRRLEISSTSYSSRHEPVTDLISLVQKPGESEEALLIRGADLVAERLEEDWKLENLLSHDGGGVSAVTVPISGLKDWLDVKRRLAAVSVVRHTEMVLMSLDEVRINLHYVGDPDQLRTALGQTDLMMVREDEEWVLYPAGAVPPDKS